MDNKRQLNSNEIEIKSFTYDWFIAFSVIFLVTIISIPPLIWKEEEAKINESRKRMLDLAYALKSYENLVGTYTEDKDLIIETIMNVRDSLVADEYLNGKKNIYMSCSYDATFIQNAVDNSKLEYNLNLSNIDKKDRLKYIDKKVYNLTKLDDGKYIREYLVPEIQDIKNIPDFITIVQTDYNDTTIKVYNPKRHVIDSIYANNNLVRFSRTQCEDTVKVDIPRNFGFMLDTLFSSSTIVTESVIDTIYTLKEPIKEDINDLQTSYVKNRYLFRYVPSSEYDSLWNFGFSNSNSFTLDSSYLNKWIIDTTYKLTYIDPQEFTEIEEKVSNNFLRTRLNQSDRNSNTNFWKLIECNMKGCSNCIYDDENGCIEIIEEETVDNSQGESDVSDEEWAELFAEYEDELSNEVQFGDTLIVQYSFNSRKIANVEIMNRLVNLEDYDRKRYDLNSESLICPITNKKFVISISSEDDELSYLITSPTDDNYQESRFLIFKFKPGSPGFIRDDEISWDSKPSWNYPLK